MVALFTTPGSTSSQGDKLIRALQQMAAHLTHSKVGQRRAGVALHLILRDDSPQISWPAEYALIYGLAIYQGAKRLVLSTR